MPKRKRNLSEGSTENCSPRCVRCCEELKDSFQEIFDEAGIELELQKLLGICFDLEIKYRQDDFQAICDDCLNELIEAYDIIKKNEEEMDKMALKDEIKSEKESDDEEIRNDGENNNMVIQQDDKYLDSEESSQEIDYADNYLQDLVNESLASVENIDDETADFINDVEENENSVSAHEDKDESDNVKEKSDDIDEIEAGVTENTIADSDNFNLELYENVDYVDDEDENIDIKEYKEKVIRSNFTDICFPEAIKCSICSIELKTHVDIMEHTQKEHSVEDFSYPCILDPSCDPLSSYNELNTHLVFKHYDLENLTIFSACPECLKSFHEYPAYNKHSCYKGKNISRIKTECEVCEKTFRSNKRYRFHLQFHLEKRRPKACLICDTKFRDEDAFFEHVMYTHEKNSKLVCVKCDKWFLNLKNLKNHEHIHLKERPFKCNICDKTYMAKNFLNDHITSKHSDKNPHKCTICNKTFAVKHHLRKHIENHSKPVFTDVLVCSECGFVAGYEEEIEDHIQNHGDDGKSEIQNLDIAYACEFCESAFNSVPNLIAHRDTHNKKEYYCNLCNRKYDEYKKLITHKSNHVNHGIPKPVFPITRHYVCDFQKCTKSYMQWTSLRTHRKYYHSKNVTLSCPKCLIRFENRTELNTHLKTAHAEGAFECLYCYKPFKTRAALQFHVIRFHVSGSSPSVTNDKLADGSLQCDQCTSAFATQIQLQKHMVAVHPNFECKLCGKTLKNLKSYKGHQREVHASEKKFTCKYCGKAFVNHCRRLAHEEKVHLKVQKFKCELCPFGAYYRHSFTLHMRSHRNDRPFLCDLCGKGFRMNSALQIHIKRHLGIKNFVCTYEGCSLSYPTRGLLNVHIKNRHTGEGSSSFNSRRGKPLIRSRFDVTPSDVFIDDDDGLDFDEDDKTKTDKKNVQNEEDEELVENDGLFDGEEDLNDNEQMNKVDEEGEVIGEIVIDPVKYIVKEYKEMKSSVIVKKNNSDHDYLVKPDDYKVYGSAIEES